MENIEHKAQPMLYEVGDILHEDVAGGGSPPPRTYPGLLEHSEMVEPPGHNPPKPQQSGCTSCLDTNKLGPWESYCNPEGLSWQVLIDHVEHQSQWDDSLLGT